MAATSTYKFQSEAKELLDLMVNSVYSNKDIFLRELISNSSDAVDKLRFEALSNKELEPLLDDLSIRIIRDPEGRTLSVADNGIGMNRDELRQFIGVIARSGTKEYGRLLDEARKSALPPELIGQFGVGFYSTFMVADKVALVTRRAGEEEAWLWESTGDGTYTITPSERARPGTTVTLHLKAANEEAGLRDYLDEWTIREIVRRYSDFVAHPIVMAVERTEHDRDEEGKVKPDSEPRKELRDETLNSMKAIWARLEAEVKEEEYTEFFRHIAHAWEAPLARIVSRAEGAREFRTLLFIPERAPFDLYLPDAHHGIHLYIRRVFIMNDCKELLPRYLRFIKGVVDSEDLPLNISREILQKDGNIRTIRSHIIKKVLGTLEKMREEDGEKYRRFWDQFGKVLKEGLLDDIASREKLLELALFRSTGAEGELTTLDQYLSRMKEGQEQIYFLGGRGQEALVHSPHLEAFRKKGYEVLLLSDPVDEVWVQAVHEYKGKRLQSAGQGMAQLGTDVERKEEEEKLKQQGERYKDLFALLLKRLDSHIREVRLSTRLTDSPACLVGESGDLSPQLEAMLRASGQELPATRRILEINPDHPLLEKLSRTFDLNQESPTLTRYAHLLLGQATLAEGGMPPDPAAFSQALRELMTEAL